MSQQSEEMLMIEGALNGLPATILKLLRLDVPSFLPPAIDSIVKLFESKGVERMVINMLDNFGLFEITYYKPSFLISSADVLLLLSTKNPYTLGVFHQILFGDYVFEKNNFHLLKYLQNAGKSTMFIGRDRDVKRYDGGTPSIIKPTDMATWIEAAKILPRMDFTWLNYLDFEEIYQKKQYNTGNPEEIIQKLIRRTDKWILSSYRQLRSKTLMIVLGNHGRYKIDMQYQGKVAEWRAASVPLAIFMLKP